MAEIIGPGCNRGIPRDVEMPLAVQRLPNGNTIIADAGDEAGLGSEIVEVDPVGNIVWNFNENLRFAHSGRRLRNGNTLITDTTNNRLIEVTPDKRIVMNSDEWGGGTGDLSDWSHLHYPNEAFSRWLFTIKERLADEECDFVDNRYIEKRRLRLLW